MTFNNPQLSTTEPAFISNEKFSRSRPRGLHKSLADCCYSLANLALIVASLVGLVFIIKFFYDKPLYEYGEHLLSLSFYHQLIYLLVVFCLVLLVPLLNAIGACCFTTQRKPGPLASTKLIYEVLLGMMVFVGLAFVAPYIRSASVATHLLHELRRHMKLRYEQDFSYVLVDRIQEEYKCCDEPWYRAIYNDRLPATCYEPDGTYSNMLNVQCADVIGEVVANRCIVLVSCLVAILVSLGVLLAIDLIQLLANSSRGGRNYNVGAREAKLARVGVESHDQNEEEGANSSINRASESRLRSEEEEERDEPLLSSLQDGTRSSTPKLRDTTIDQEEDNTDPYNSRLVYQPTTAPILAKTQILPGLRGRPQSPIFVGADSGGANQAALGTPITTKLPAKGVLKKSPASSIQPIDSDDEDQSSDDGGFCDSLKQNSRQQPSPGSSKTPRDSPTRRSLLSVRFA